jgi:FlaA1/EpsC-like NDP-sugar epimerase
LALKPARLIVLEHSEYALYQIEQELKATKNKAEAKLHLDFILGSVTDPAKLSEVFSRSRVDTVYHAAAYKHVPIVEDNPLEGFKNNVLGTWYLAQAAAKARVAHFVLISSDKAVRPTNVMGATKRMAELVLQVQSERHSSTVFSMVRFGNVLESSGSVVPLFRAQIEAGGPVTLTHPDVTRYFMTIQEAVQLVIQAGAMAHSGEVFVLDMGSPVKIKDLAVRMIRLSGRSVRDQENPKGDIAIEVIGLRPGEKLFEELLISGQAIGTAHPRICQVREASADGVRFDQDLQRVHDRRHGASAEVDVQEILARWVAGYSAQTAQSQAAAELRAPAATLVSLAYRKP